MACNTDATRWLFKKKSTSCNSSAVFISPSHYLSLSNLIKHLSNLCVHAYTSDQKWDWMEECISFIASSSIVPKPNALPTIRVSEMNKSVVAPRPRSNTKYRSAKNNHHSIFHYS